MLSVLIFAWIVISIICLWVLIEQRKRVIFLLCFIPIFLILTTSTYFTVSALFGYPTKGPLPAKFIYLSHIVVEPNNIYFWVIVPGESEPRSYDIPYNKRLHNQAGKAQKMTAEGNYVMGQFKLLSSEEDNWGQELGDRSGGGRTKGGDFVFYKFDYQDMMPKEPSNTNTVQEE